MPIYPGGVERDAAGKMTTCAPALLKRLRKDCHPNILNWGCEPRGGWEHSAQVSFRIKDPVIKHGNAHWEKCVAKAIAKASPPEQRDVLKCKPMRMVSNEMDDDGNVIPDTHEWSPPALNF